MRRTLLLPLCLAAATACSDDGTEPRVEPEPLAFDSIVPARGTVGTEVRLYGQAVPADSFEVFFGALKSPRVEWEGGDIFALAPDGLVPDAVYDVRVERRGGGADTLPAAFRAVPPTIDRVNGVSKPTGLIGMTVIIEGAAFGDDVALGRGKVYFQDAAGAPIEAAIADAGGDWTDGFIVTTVPEGTASSSRVWVETATGASDTIDFGLISSGTFSPSLINWTSTSPLPQPLQALGAAFVPIEDGAAPANYVYTVGGADSLHVATTAVYRAQVLESGALGPWDTGQTPLPEPRAYHVTVAATAYTAALDSTTAAFLYAIGGKDGDGRTTRSVFYARVALDGQVGAWQSTHSTPVPLHAAAATVFRGYVYLAGGADSLGTARANVYRARVGADGGLGGWEPSGSLPEPVAYFTLSNFGPYVYVAGGEAGASAPQSPSQTGTETAHVRLARVNLRTGGLADDGWSTLSLMAKARSKHSAIIAGGALLVTSGVYAGQPGSSENTYASLNHDGTLGSWQGATGAETISAEIGYSLYNQAAVTFIDAAGRGHVLVLGGADRANAGRASAAVVYY